MTDIINKNKMDDKKIIKQETKGQKEMKQKELEKEIINNKKEYELYENNKKYKLIVELNNGEILFNL